MKGKKCPNCGSKDVEINRKSGEVLCRSCGLVIEDNMIDHSQEWRNFEEERENRRRTGAPITHGNPIDRTVISTSYKNMSSNKRRMFRHLKKWQKRMATATERNLTQASIELTRIASQLNVPERIIEDAKRIYQMAVYRGLVRGRSMESVLAGALYAATRRGELPRTLNEVSEASGIGRKEVGRTYRFITRELSDMINILPTKPSQYIPRFSSSLNLSPKARAESMKIVKKAHELELTSGRGPTGIAAAALYIASLMHGEKRTQREVAEVAGVTEVTIRNRYKELVDVLDLNDKLKKNKRGRRSKKEMQGLND